MLNAEEMPDWFRPPPSFPLKRHPVLSPGFSGHFLLAVWSLTGSVLAYALLCNLRTMLLVPILEQAIDTTQDLVLSGRTPHLPDDFTKGGASWFADAADEWGRAVHENNLPR